MCNKASDYANNINSQIIEVKEYYNKLKVKEKTFNNVQQDLLHKIESLDKFDLYEGWKLTKSLQKLRQTRRETKNEIRLMEVLINQIGMFRIKENKINIQNDILEKSKYHARQIKMNDDILSEINEILDSEYEEHKIYALCEKIPKIKHSSIKIKYKSEQEKQHIINKIAFSYNNYQLNSDEQYVELIDRKQGYIK